MRAPAARRRVWSRERRSTLSSPIRRPPRLATKTGVFGVRGAPASRALIDYFD